MSDFTKAELAKVADQADLSGLPDFDGRSVIRSEIAVTNAGDGLSAAMAVSPRPLHLGDEVTIVLTGRVTKVNHAAIDPKGTFGDGPLIRQHTIRAGDSTILDAESTQLVVHVLDRQRDAIRRAVDAAKGVQELASDDEHPFDDEIGEPDEGDADDFDAEPGNVVELGSVDVEEGQ